MKKILALVAVVAMVAAMATACGNKTTSSSVGSSTSVSESKYSEKENFGSTDVLPISFMLISLYSDCRY